MFAPLSDLIRLLSLVISQAKKRKLNDSQAAPSPVVSSPPPPPQACYLFLWAVSYRMPSFPFLSLQPAVDALGDWAKLPKSEVFSRLRSMMLPVTLFGETDEMRCRRLREAELQHEERQTNIHAFNVNQQIEQEIEQEIAQAAAAGTHGLSVCLSVSWPILVASYLLFVLVFLLVARSLSE